MILLYQPNLGELQLHRADQPEHRHFQLCSSRVLRLWQRGAALNFPYFLLVASLFSPGALPLGTDGFCWELGRSSYGAAHEERG